MDHLGIIEKNGHLSPADARRAHYESEAP